MDYEAYWKDWRSAGPVEFVGVHHVSNTPRPHLSRLCDEAEGAGYRVLLVASDRVLDRDTAGQRRELDYLAIESRNDRLAGHVEPVDSDGEIDGAAQRLRSVPWA